MSSENYHTDFDDGKAEAFSEKLLTALNYGSLSLMMSIGHRTGIFDTMRSMPPSTSGEVAKASGLDERYVREWLGAMVTAGVIDVDQILVFCDCLAHCYPSARGIWPVRRKRLIARADDG